MFEKITKYPIGIDINDRHIFAAQLRTGRQGIAVRELAHGEIDGDWQADDTPAGVDALRPVLKEITKNKNFAGKRAVLHIPPRNIISFPIRFKLAGAESLEQGIVRESKQYVPFALEDAIIDYPSLESVSPQDGRHYKAIMIAARKVLIETYVEILKQAGFVVEAVDFQVSSLLRLHRHLHDAVSQPVILCHMGMTQTLLVVVNSDSILAQRYITTGLQHLLGKITDNLGFSCEDESAKIMLKKYGLAYQYRQPMDDGIEADRMARVIYQILIPQIEALVYELHKVIGYVRSESPNTVFERIYFYGHGAFIPHLDDHLEKRLSIPAQLINPLLQMVGSDDGILIDKHEGAPFAMAMGLAMRKIAWL